MPLDTREDRFTHRINDLYAHDPQFAAAQPLPEVSAAAAALPLPQLIKAVFDGYAERPAVGQRATRLHRDAETGRTTRVLEPAFETLTYAQLWSRIDAVAGAWAATVQPGDRVAVLGFTSVDYTVVDLALFQLGAVAVPLQTSASAAQLAPIVAETEPTVIAAGIDYLTEATELAQSGPAPKALVVFDFHSDDDEHRAALDATIAALAGTGITVTTLADEIGRGLRHVPTACAPDSLALLVYTSGSTGAPKGAMYLQRKVADMWTAAAKQWDDDHGGFPAIVLSFMPMSHVMGRGALYGALSTGGTVYFAARADLSTFLDDLALVRPTQLSLVPRVWDMIHQEVQREVERSEADEDAVLAEKRRTLLGGRFVTAMSGSAPLAPELKAWLERFLDMHVGEGFGSTEAGAIFVDGQIRRPPVTDYKLVDVPELGYFATDLPHPRGELLIKSEQLFPGYYRRPEVTAEVFDADGFYRTGDIVAELGPTVCSTSTGETTCSSFRRASSSPSPSWRQRSPPVR